MRDYHLSHLRGLLNDGGFIDKLKLHHGKEYIVSLAFKFPFSGNSSDIKLKAVENKKEIKVINDGILNRTKNTIKGIGSKINGLIDKAFF